LIRFFTHPEKIIGNKIRLSEEDRRHIRSLRLRPQEDFVVCDGDGTDYICKLSAGKAQGVADIVRQEKTQGEPTIHPAIYLAYAKCKRLDYAVQKAVELGAKSIVIFKSKRSLAPDNLEKKMERLNKIAHEAAKQSGRGIIPTVENCGKYEEAIDSAINKSSLAILLFENENTLHLRKVLEQHFPKLDSTNASAREKIVSIMSGPEGGFEDSEIDMARVKGANVVSLGKRILRSETAPIAALSALMYHTDNL